MYRDRASSIQNINSRYQVHHQVQNIHQSYQKNKPDIISTKNQTSPAYESVIDPHQISHDRGVTYLGETSRRSKCPTWIWISILLLLTTIGILAVYYFFYRKADYQINPILGQTKMNNYGIMECEYGFFMSNGRCLKCPPGSQWTGTTCSFSKNLNIIPSEDNKASYRPQDLALFIRDIYGINGNPNSFISARHLHKRMDSQFQK